MFLTTPDLPYYLVSRGLLDGDHLIDGAYRSIELRRRNRNFKVITSGGGLFVKQVPGVFPEAVTCLEREAISYYLTTSHSDFAALASVMPRFRSYDPHSHILTIELIQHSENFSELFFRTQAVSEALGASLGGALGRLHADGPRMMAHTDALAPFTREPPWALTIAQDPKTNLGNATGGHRELVQCLRSDRVLFDGLCFLRDHWQPTAFIHGDLKGDNILVPLSAQTLQDCPLWIVDWELASVGDPSWDVASVFSMFLEFCIRSRPDEAATLMHVEGGYPNRSFFSTVGPVLAAFWEQYARSMQLPSEQEVAYRHRCIHFVAGRLLRSSFDLLIGSPRLTPTVMPFLHLARAILLDPARADAELLGFHHSVP